MTDKDPQVETVRAGLAHLENELTELKRYREREPLVQELLALLNIDDGKAQATVIDAADAVREFKVYGASLTREQYDAKMTEPADITDTSGYARVKPTRATRETASPGSGLWWLSFAAADGFRGVVLTRAGSFIEANQKTHMLGVNPGGEVRGFEVPITYAYLFRAEELDRCHVDKAKAEELAARMEGSPR